MKYINFYTKFQFATIILLAVSFSVFGQVQSIPSGYYNAAQGLSGYELKTSLHNIIKAGHSAQSYGALYGAYEDGDTDPTDGYVWDMYSENPNGTDPYNFTHYSDKCGNYSSEGDCYNREHLFPQGIFNKQLPMRTDYHHVVPSDGKVNGMRSNYPFGETNNPNWTSQNGSKRGPCSLLGYSGTIFEPIDEYKGDIARCMLYFATRYQDKVAGWSHAMLNGTSDQVYADWFIDILVAWHHNDPVSEKEYVRNETGYEFQGNRNPYIDHPEYVAMIWGGNAPSVFSNISIFPEEPTNSDPVQVSCNVTNAEGVNTVELIWGTNESDLGNSIEMSNSSGSLYTTSSSIPAQNDGTTVYYKIKAIDNQNSTSYSSQNSYSIGDVPEEFVFVNENFETTTDHEEVVIGGWTNYNQVGSRKWEGRVFDGNKYAQISSYQSGEENTVWLITPQINLENTSNEFFSFDVNVAYWKHSGLSVLISNNFDGTNVSSATWKDITSNFSIPTEPSSGYGVMSPAGTLSLNDYSGINYIAFKYDGNENNSQTTTYQIDNVLIKGFVTGGQSSIVKPNNSEEIIVYPNPVKDKLFFRNIEDNQSLNILLLDINGKVVSSFNNYNLDFINMENQKSGIYILKIVSNSIINEYLIMKQ